MFVVKFKCEKCNRKSIAYPIIKRVKVNGFEKEFETIYITEIICENCGNKYVVQIDNDYTYTLLEKQKRLNYDIGTTRFKYGASARRIKKTEDRLKTVSAKLLKERAVLNKLYDNTEYYIDDNISGIIKIKDVKISIEKEQ